MKLELSCKIKTYTPIHKVNLYNLSQTRGLSSVDWSMMKHAYKSAWLARAFILHFAVCKIVTFLIINALIGKLSFLHLIFFLIIFQKCERHI